MTPSPLDHTPATNPYVGPRTYEPEDSERFFGREREARELLALVISERLVLFYAQSGAGKSSLINTRLITGLRTEGFEVLLPVGRVTGELPAELDPAQVKNIFVYNLIARFNEALPASEQQPPSHLAGLTLAQFLGAEEALPPAATPMSLEDGAVTASPPLPSYQTAPTVLIIDQFEEILTTHLDRWQERTHFFQQLRDAQTIFPNLWIVLAMREDYVAGLDPYTLLLPDRLRARFHMQRMGYAAALEAVTYPAERIGGRRFFAGVAEQLVDNLSLVQNVWADDARSEPTKGEFVEPVQLQVVCYQLWEQLQARDEARPAAAPLGATPTTDMAHTSDSSYITLADLQLLAEGRELAEFVNLALANYYTRAIRVIVRTPGLNLSEREVRDWFSHRLITAEGTRSLVQQRDRDSDVGGLPVAAARLLENQFLIRAESHASGRWYELTHDRFVEPIRQANRKWHSTYHNPVATAYQLWKEAGQLDSRFLLGDNLQAAQDFDRQNPYDVTQDERDFLKRSRHYEHESRQRRLRTRLITAVVIVALAVLTGWAMWNANRAEQKAEIAFVRQLLAQAELTYEENPLLGLRLALEADAHLSQEDAPLRDQINRSVDRYVQRGRIATLSNSASGLLAVPVTTWLIIQNYGADRKDELRHKADGMKVADLAGSVSRVDMVSEGFPFFIVDYTGDTPDELRSKTDGAKIPDLAGSGSGVIVIGEDFPFFIVYYTEGKPSELRSKTDGAKISDLAGSVSSVTVMGEDSPFFVVGYTGDIPGEFRRKTDGAKVPNLAGSVSNVNALSKNFPFFVITYTDDTPGELRRKTDGSKVPDLAGSVDGVTVVGEDFPFFVVYYAGDTPTELRRKADGSKVTDLTGSIDSVNALSAESSFFIVDYTGDTPGELRRKADGSKAAVLTGPLDSIDVVNEDFPFFIVDHTGDTPTELRRKTDGLKVPDLTGSVSTVNAVSKNFPFFVITYADDTPGELRRKVDGSKVPDLTESVSSVHSVNEAFPFFVVDYTGDTPDELRRKADGSKATVLTSSIDRVDVVNEDFPFFIVDYTGDIPTELRRKADGSKAAVLTGSLDSIDVVNEDFPFFIVDYTGDTPGELRRKADGSKVPDLAGSVSNVNTMSESSPFFVVYYANYTLSELRRKVDGSKVPDLTGLVDRVDTVNEDFPFFIVDYTGDTPTELRRKVDGSKVPDLTGLVDRVYILSANSPFFIVDYTGDTLGELRRKADGSKAATLTGSVDGVAVVGEDFPFFIVYYASDTPDELRRKADGAKIPDLTGSVDSVTALSVVSPFFIVDYTGDIPTELRRKADGSKAATLTGSVNSVNAVNEDFPFFIVDYTGDTPDELRRKVDGSKVSVLTDSVISVAVVSEDFPFFIVYYASDTPDELRRKVDGSKAAELAGSFGYNPAVAPNHFFLLRSYNKHIELWQVIPLQPLVDLGISLSWENEFIASNSVSFHQAEQTLAVRYEDGPAYLLDLAWLAETNATEQSTHSCLPFVTHPFTLSLLLRPEYLAERPSLACAEPIQLVAQGNIAARQLDVAKAQDLFAKALALDPSLPITLAAKAKSIAATTLAQKSGGLSLQGDPLGALSKLASAHAWQPQIDVHAYIDPIAFQLLRQAQNSLKEGSLISTTETLETLLAMDEALGAGTLSQEVKKIAVQRYVALGEVWALDNAVQEAAAAFAQAAALDAERKPDLAPLVEAAQRIASSGAITAAVTAYQQILVLDPSLPFTPAVEANLQYATTLVEVATRLAQRREITASLAAISRALQLDAQTSISVTTWNPLCWYGTLTGLANQVNFACEKAVTLAPQDASTRRNRGLARALRDDRASALADFQHCASLVDSLAASLAGSDPGLRWCKLWVERMEAGEDLATIFDGEMLAGLRAGEVPLALATPTPTPPVSPLATPQATAPISPLATPTATATKTR